MFTLSTIVIYHLFFLYLIIVTMTIAKKAKERANKISEGKSKEEIINKRDNINNGKETPRPRIKTGQ